MNKHDERIDKKIAGPTWDNVRDKLIKIHEIMLGVHESSTSELRTIYIKYKTLPEPLAPVFAAMWIKTAKKIILGLATPEKLQHKDVIGVPPGIKYKGLTSFLEITENCDVPVELEQWAKLAFNYASESN